MTTRFHILFFLLALILPVSASLSDSEIETLLKEGETLFQKANDLTAKQPEQAKNLYQKSALRFERIAREGGVENGKLYYNIGNAYFRADDLGRAILNYRKAEQFNPNDSNVKQNLAYARAQRTDELGDKEEAKVLKTLLFWHYDFSFNQRFILFAIVFLLLWAAAATRLFVKRPFLKWIIGISAAFSAVLAASLITEARALGNEQPGVVIADEIIARKGDSESYEASFQESLHAGAEFVLVEDRQNWLHVELPDGRRCWLPSRAVAMVR